MCVTMITVWQPVSVVLNEYIIGKLGSCVVSLNQYLFNTREIYPADMATTGFIEIFTEDSFIPSSVCNIMSIGIL